MPTSDREKREKADPFLVDLRREIWFENKIADPATWTRDGNMLRKVRHEQRFHEPFRDPAGRLALLRCMHLAITAKPDRVRRCRTELIDERRKDCVGSCGGPRERRSKPAATVIADRADGSFSSKI